MNDVGLQVNAGERIGLIGPNGAGKTTLFSILLGREQPDAGEVILQRGRTIGFLPQESAPTAGETVLELALGVNEELRAALRVLREHPDPASPEHIEALATYAEQNGHALAASAKRILAGLAFHETHFERGAGTLSGGWIMRAHLARLLLMEPDLLLLDEPTNHLDLECLGWFQNHLLSLSSAILTISHDREFLNATCRHIVEIRGTALRRYRGNYDDYTEQRRAEKEHQLAAYKNQQREIQTIESFINRFRAKASKAAQVQERIKALARMERIEAPEPEEATVRFQFPQPGRGGQRVVSLEKVRQAYGAQVVYPCLDLVIERGQRIALVGPNGAGKTTLLKILAGQLPLQAGERKTGHQVTIGYFSQQRAETLNLKRTVLEEATAPPAAVPEQTARNVLGSFLFRGEDVHKPVGVLSGGEKSRLTLVKLLLAPPNLLLLDEPTTHLDLASIDALTTALRAYPGTVLMVSHDAHFIRSLADNILHIDSGRVTPYAGGYDYFLEKSRLGETRASLVARLGENPALQKSPAPSVSASQKPGLKEQRARRKAESLRRQAEKKKRREAERRAKELEHTILALEEKQTQLAKELEHPETYADPNKSHTLNRELLDVMQTLESANEQWMEIADLLAPDDNQEEPHLQETR